MHRQGPVPPSRKQSLLWKKVSTSTVPQCPRGLGDTTESWSTDQPQRMPAASSTASSPPCSLPSESSSKTSPKPPRVPQRSHSTRLTMFAPAEHSRCVANEYTPEYNHHAAAIASSDSPDLRRLDEKLAPVSPSCARIQKAATLGHVSTATVVHMDSHNSLPLRTLMLSPPAACVNAPPATASKLQKSKGPAVLPKPKSPTQRVAPPMQQPNQAITKSKSSTLPLPRRQNMTDGTDAAVTVTPVGPCPPPRKHSLPTSKTTNTLLNEVGAAQSNVTTTSDAAKDSIDVCSDRSEKRSIASIKADIKSRKTLPLKQDQSLTCGLPSRNFSDSCDEAFFMFNPAKPTIIDSRSTTHSKPRSSKLSRSPSCPQAVSNRTLLSGTGKKPVRPAPPPPTNYRSRSKPEPEAIEPYAEVNYGQVLQALLSPPPRQERACAKELRPVTESRSDASAGESEDNEYILIDRSVHIERGSAPVNGHQGVHHHYTPLCVSTRTVTVADGYTCIHVLPNTAETTTPNSTSPSHQTAVCGLPPRHTATGQVGRKQPTMDGRTRGVAYENVSIPSKKASHNTKLPHRHSDSAPTHVSHVKSASPLQSVSHVNESALNGEVGPMEQVKPAPDKGKGKGVSYENVSLKSKKQCLKSEGVSSGKTKGELSCSHSGETPGSPVSESASNRVIADSTCTDTVARTPVKVPYVNFCGLPINEYNARTVNDSASLDPSSPTKDIDVPLSDPVTNGHAEKKHVTNYRRKAYENVKMKPLK